MISADKAGGYSRKQQAAEDTQEVIDKIYHSIGASLTKFSGDLLAHRRKRKEPEPLADACVTPAKKKREEEKNPQTLARPETHQAETGEFDLDSRNDETHGCEPGLRTDRVAVRR